MDAIEEDSSSDDEADEPGYVAEGVVSGDPNSFEEVWNHETIEKE